MTAKVNAPQTRHMEAVYFVEPVKIEGERYIHGGSVAIGPTIHTNEVTKIIWGKTSPNMGEVFAKNIKFDGKPYATSRTTVTSTSTTFSTTFSEKDNPKKIEIELSIKGKKYIITLTLLDLKKFNSCVKDGYISRPPRVKSTEEGEATKEIQNFYLDYEPGF